LVHGFQDELVLNFNGDYPGGSAVAGHKLVLRGPDLEIDYQPRRSTVGSGHRRALVHGFKDELVLNFSGDYPGGTAVNGSKLVMKGPDLEIDCDTRRRSGTTGPRRALVHGFQDELIINYNRDYPGGITILGSVSVADQLSIAGVDVALELAALKQRIQQLEARVVALENP